MKNISKGDVEMEALDGEKWNKIVLKHVLFVPSTYSQSDRYWIRDTCKAEIRNNQFLRLQTQIVETPCMK